MDRKPLTTEHTRFNNPNKSIDTGGQTKSSQYNFTAQWGHRTVRLAQPVNYYGGQNPKMTFHQSAQASACLLNSGSVLPTASSSTPESNELCYHIKCYEKILRTLEPRKHSNTLYSAEIISMDDMEEVQALSRPEGAQLLLDKVQKYFYAANPHRRLEIISELCKSFEQHHQQHLIKFLNPSYLISAVQPTAATALKKKPNINQRVAETGPNFPVNTRYPHQITDHLFENKHNINMPDIKTLSISEENTTQYNRSDAQSRACEHEEISSKPGAEEKYPVQETNYDA